MINSNIDYATDGKQYYYRNQKIEVIKDMSPYWITIRTQDGEVKDIGYKYLQRFYDTARMYGMGYVAKQGKCS